MPDDAMSMFNDRGWRREADLLWRGPSEGAVGGVGGIVVLLHDADGRSPLGDAAWTDALDRSRLAAVAPLAVDGWWTDRLAEGEAGPTAEATVIAASAWAHERWAAPLALAGVGAGGHGALRIAYKRAREFPVVAAWRPAVDCHLLIDGRLASPPGLGRDAVRSLAARYRDAEQCRQDAALLHLHPLGWPRRQWIGSPTGDPWWEGADRLRQKLFATGVPFEGELDKPANANDPAVADRVVRWIAAALR